MRSLSTWKKYSTQMQAFDTYLVIAFDHWHDLESALLATKN